MGNVETKPETRENIRENIEEERENEIRSFYTPTKSVRINSTQNNDTCSSRNSGISTPKSRHHADRAGNYPCCLNYIGWR